MTEVGDYFCVPSEFKPYTYMSMLISQKNYRDTTRRFVCSKTSYGSIVLLAQVNDEIPPYEFASSEGILSISSRKNVQLAQAPDTPLGERPVVAKRTQQQIMDMMSHEMKLANLPWWWEKGTFRWNGEYRNKRPEDSEAFVKNNRKHFGGPNTPYPEFYNLDENLIKRPVVDEEEEEDWGPDPIFTDEEQASGGDDT